MKIILDVTRKEADDIYWSVEAKVKETRRPDLLTLLHKLREQLIGEAGREG